MNKNSSVYNKGGINLSYINLDKDYVDGCGGILNAIITASAQYMYKVIERHCDKNDIKRYDSKKINNLRHLVIHANAHLDEYFAELLFRALLPPYLKDIELKEHIIVSKYNDILSRIIWPNSVVFGIDSDDSGGALPLSCYDEHMSDGNRVKLSCSQMVAEEFLKVVPYSIKVVLDEVNYSDANRGAHEYNLKNIITSIHNTLFYVGYDSYKEKEITKYLTQNWKRAIIDACVVSVIYAYENKIFIGDELNENTSAFVARSVYLSLQYYISNSTLKYNTRFEKIKKSMLYRFRNGGLDLEEKAIWMDIDGSKVSHQILIINRICFALERCWGYDIAKFVMMHIWQEIFQGQMIFDEIYDAVRILPENELRKTIFGSVKKIHIINPGFLPEIKKNDARKKRVINNQKPLWIIELNITDPLYYVASKVFKYLINSDYCNMGNNGFALFLMHDKNINSKVLNVGATVPYNVWKKISDTIVNQEPERWYQLKDSMGLYADYIINRNKAHQYQLPTEKVDIEYIKELIESISVE